MMPQMMIAAMSVVLEVNAQEPCKGDGGNGRTVREMMHPLNGQQWDQNRLCAGGDNRGFLHDVKLKGPTTWRLSLSSLRK